jgi:hypothetical protein
VLWTVTLVVLLLGSLFARDVIHSAHGAISTRRAEDRNFAALANVLVTQENQFDEHLEYLLSTGQSLSRAHFEARLQQLEQQLPTWLTQASLLDEPVLAHHVNSDLASLTETRVNDYQSLLANVATSLQLPWSPTPARDVTQSPQSAQASLVTSTATWSRDRWALVREPGRVTLPTTSDQVGTLNLSSALANLAASPSLQVTRGIGVTAVLVDPSPLPAPSGELLLPPTGSIRLGITVTNASYVRQNVAIRYTFVQTNGARTSHAQATTTTLGPLGSFAFVPRDVATVAGERAQLTIDVSGAPAGPGMSTSRHYLVIVSPSGNS